MANLAGICFTVFEDFLSEYYLFVDKPRKLSAGVSLCCDKPITLLMKQILMDHGSRLMARGLAGLGAFRALHPPPSPGAMSLEP